MAEPTISWNDILEVGQGGPGCGQLYIDGKQPKGAFRYLPPALFHDGKVYASTFVPGGFIVAEIDPVTLVRREVTARLPYARLEAIEDGEIVYVDRHGSDSIARVAIHRPQPFIARLAGRFGKR
ncbi:MAG: hypothetical protein K2X68_09490 [Novosphingobium sp.]|nr:hypothetical protein [Novosphingobium sp.]